MAAGGSDDGCASDGASEDTDMMRGMPDARYYELKCFNYCEKVL